MEEVDDIDPDWLLGGLKFGLGVLIFLLTLSVAAADDWRLEADTPFPFANGRDGGGNAKSSRI